MGLGRKTKDTRRKIKSRIAETEEEREIRLSNHSIYQKSLRLKRKRAKNLIDENNGATSKKKAKNADEIHELEQSQRSIHQVEQQSNNGINDDQSHHCPDSEEYPESRRISPVYNENIYLGEKAFESSYEFPYISMMSRRASDSIERQEQGCNISANGNLQWQPSVEYPQYDRKGHPIIEENENFSGYFYKTQQSDVCIANVLNLEEPHEDPANQFRQSPEYPNLNSRRSSQEINHSDNNVAQNIEQQRSVEYPLFDSHGHPINSADEEICDRPVNLSRFERPANEIDQAVAEFQQEIWQFSDTVCVVCRKRCYKKQTCTVQILPDILNILPTELKRVGSIVSCLRSANLLRGHKTPSQAYWNEMHLDVIPPEIASLSEVEKRLLSRIIPFLKIIKLTGRFGQYGLRGQAVLFAQDVGDIAEQLPLNITDAGLAFITETRENVENCREYCVNIDNLKNAMTVLKRINPLYHDVEVNYEALSLNLAEICQVSQNSEENVPENNIQDIQVTQLELTEIAGGRAIVRGSFHQGHARFSDDSRGRQCTANAAVAIAASNLKDSARWSSNFIDNW